MMMDKKINIYISYHKKCFLPSDNKLLFPIQVGSAISDSHYEGTLHDDVGDNISDKNPSYCELTAQYWAWKNAKADYYGFFHYRRYMSFSKYQHAHSVFQDVEFDYLTPKIFDDLHLNEDEMYKTITKYDVIATTPVYINQLDYRLKNNYQQYSKTSYLHSKDMDLLMEIIKEKYPDYYSTAYEYIYKKPYGYFCNMFIMKKELFMEYSEWLFDILFEHEKRSNYSNYSPEGFRVSGHLGERLFGIYYEYIKKTRHIKTCELQRTLFKHVQPIAPIEPAFDVSNIPIVIACNDYYGPYVSTLLLSIIDCSSDENNYDIILLSNDLSEKIKQVLSKQIAHKKNFALRVVDPEYFLEGYNLFTTAHFTKETYYRLLLPELLPYYSKVLWIDVDMIVMSDLASLYQIDIGGYLIGAAYDPDSSGLYNGYLPDKKKYVDQEMGLENPYGYFQAGTLLINLDKFRETYSVKYVLDFAQSKKWQLLDQDILNVLCQNKVKYIDMAWNVLFDHQRIRYKEIISLAPIWQVKMYQEARNNPKIIHYAGFEKPWLNPEADFAEVFWSYAKKTPFYELMLLRMSEYAAKQADQKAAKEKRDKRGPMYKTIRCLFLYGPLHTWREIKTNLNK